MAALCSNSLLAHVRCSYANVQCYLKQHSLHAGRITFRNCFLTNVYVDIRVCCSLLDIDCLRLLCWLYMFILCSLCNNFSSISVGPGNVVCSQRNITPVEGMKAYEASRFITPYIPNLGANWGRVANITHRLIFPRERNPVPIE